jgi:hypothetical protein
MQARRRASGLEMADTTGHPYRTATRPSAPRPPMVQSSSSRREAAQQRRAREARKAALYAELARETEAAERGWTIQWTDDDVIELLLVAARALCILLTL